MKYISILLALIVNLSCNSTKTQQNSLKKVVQKSYCPEDGTCSFRVEKGKALQILKDEFGNSYPEFNNSNDYLLVFEYHRNEIEGTADSNYTEKIFVQCNPKSPEVHLKDSQLKDVNLAFARICFCKGQTGYYAVEDGSLNISKTGDKTYSLELEFACREVPQVITKISETFTLD